ncbi:MAG TPA: nuclear transport factor 2 family protein [Candidatus Acidoferrum sp.]|nr:nuclear transport factor 2 family protein [Candidatus Acidoferrum sp.]
MRILLACLLLLSGSLLLSTQTASGDLGDGATILALEHAWNQAEAKGDTRTLDSLLADSLLYTDWDGSFMTKPEFLASVKKSPIQGMTLTNDSEQVQMFGDSAVVAGVYHEKGNDRGHAYARNGRFTDTWVKENGAWVCVASQSTLLAAK